MDNLTFEVRDLRESPTTYVVVTSLMILMMLALLIWDIMDLKVKREPFQ